MVGSRACECIILRNLGVAPKIKLRGEEPLVVVDGVPTNQAFSDFKL